MADTAQPYEAQSHFGDRRQRSGDCIPHMVLSLFVRASVRSYHSVPLVITENLIRLSYGTGRPAILKDDESIWECRHLLQHPLAIEDDMRLVSTVELMAIRERVHNNIPVEGPIDHSTFDALQQADGEFRHWYTTWDTAFSQKYEDAGESLSPSYMYYRAANPNN